MGARERPARPGRYVIAEIEREWHVLYAPDDLPHHFLSVGRFQDRNSAFVYAEIEDSWAEEPGTHADAAGAAPVVAPPAPRAEPAKVSAAENVREPMQPAPAPVAPATPEPIPQPATPEGEGDVLSAQAAKVAIDTPTAPATAQSTMAANREKALDHYAEHGGSQAEVAVRTGIPLGTLSGFMSIARREGDPRIAAGDAKRRPMPVAATRAIEQAQKARATEAPKAAPSVIRAAAPLKSAAPKPRVEPLPDGRKRTHAEMVEAAKRAVPAPSFGDRRGVSCKTG